MAPVDWRKIMSVDVETMEEDEADAMYDLVADFDTAGEADVDRLQQLFLVTQAVMIIKGQQSEMAMEELEKMGKAAGVSDSEAKRRYQEQIADLENEIKDLKRFGGASSKDTRFVREEIQDLERQVEVLQEDLKNVERELRNEKDQGERYASRVEELEKETSDLKRDNELSQDEIRDYRQQLDALRERMQVRRGEDADHQEKIAKKNRDLIEALDENQQLQDFNIQLRNENEELQKRLAEATEQMERTAIEHAKLKNFVQHSDDNIDEVRKQNELLKIRVDDLQEQLKMKHGDDDEIMIAVNEKVEEWKQVLLEKDAEVLDYHQQVRQLKEQIAQTNIDSERTSIAVLTKAVEERDRQIRLQQQELEQARSDLESTARIIEGFRNELQKTGRGPSDRHILQIKELNDKITDLRERAASAESNMRHAEDDAAVKDKSLNEALERMRQYEQGEYGLSEAVDEIKALKTQVGVRDRQIGELTQLINKNEMKINDLSDENEQLREKLGIQPEQSVDLATYRLQKNTEKQQDRALNQVLQKEIESLEEERVELKKEIRKMAQKTGQRAAALGITEEFDLGMGAGRRSVKRPSDKTVDSEAVANLQEEIDKQVNRLEKANNDNKALKATNERLADENRKLQTGLNEIVNQLKEGKVGTQGPLQSQALEKLVSMMESKRVGGDYDAVLYQKARADNLEGRVDELRRELRESRTEHSTMKLEVSKLEATIEKLHTEVEASRDPLLMNRTTGSMPLPKSMTATSAEVVAALNEYLINVLQDVHLKEELLNKITEKLEIYKRKFAVVRHQLGTVYSDYLEEKKSWNAEKKDYEKKLLALSDQVAVKDTRCTEFDHLLDTLNQSDDEIKRRLAEESRKITVARVNETNLTRRYNALMDIENATRRECNKLKSEMIEMELTVTERVGYLLRYKDMAAFKIEHLHKELENSVPSSELDDLGKRHCELTEKYRDLLEKGNLLIAKKEEFRALEVENQELKRFNEEVKKILEIEKEKCHVLESHLDLEGSTGGHLTEGQASSISKKLTMLEMKELNERQRAEHAQKMFQQIRSTNHVLESRNAELELKFAELTETVLQSQRTEQSLRDQLDNSVSKTENERQRSKLLQLEKNEKHLKDEITKLKQITEVSLLQASCLDAQQVSRDKENLSLRQQLLDIQQNSDEKTIIGKLHRQIVRLQVSEGAAVRKFEQAKKRILSLEAHVLRLEEVIDDKEETFSHKQAEHRVNVKNLKKTIQSLRENFCGALPLRQVERLSKSTAELQSNRAQLQSDLKKAQDEKSLVEDELAEIQLKHESLNELLCTFQDVTGAKKVVEWHSKMEGLRLEELKHKRTISKLKQKCKYLEELIEDHEKSIQVLEAENVRMTKDSEERQLIWEQREIHLETKIDQLEKNQAKITSAAATFTAVTDSLPDANMPIPEQLDMAVITIKKNVKTILDVKAENTKYRQKYVELTEMVKRLERDLLTKDRIIAEMRLRMPANSDRDGIMRMLVEAASTVEDPEDLHANSTALKIAKSTISSLQARIAQKEESIAKYQALLQQSREDLNVANKRHDEEMQLIQEKLHSQSESAFARFKQISQDILQQPTSGTLSKQQAARLRELEEVVCQQDNSMAALALKLNASRQKALQWQEKYDELMVTFEQEKGDLVAAGSKMEADSNETQIIMESKIKELTVHVSGLEKDLQIQKSMNERAPTAAMRKLVDKLKNQLAVKEKQHAALSQALSEVRSDMLQQAEAYVVSASQGAKSDNNVQKIVSERTEQLRQELATAKTTVSKHQQSESELRKKVADLQNIVKKKERQLLQLQTDKHKLEQDNLELDNKVQRLKSSRLNKTNVVTDPNRVEVERLRRTVASLEAELKRKQDEAEKPFEHTVQQQAVSRWEENKVMQKTLNQLKNQITESQSEINDLRKQLDMTKRALLTANKDKQTLQNRLKAHKPESSSVKYEDLVRESISKDAVLETQMAAPLDLPFDLDSATKIRKLQEENMELRFERETFRKDIPRLKSRIQDLHNYIEVLRSENNELKGTSRSLSGTGTSGASSGLRRLGESGRSTKELEKTVMLLKKVVERLQVENERLKKSPGVLKNDDFEAIRLENEGLKNQLAELREKFGASLSNRYESSQRGIAKLSEEYDKLRRDLQKEVEINQKMRVENRHLDIENEQLKTELTVVNSSLEINEGTRRLDDLMPNSGNNLTARIMEERIKTLLVDAGKQAELMEHMKGLLKDSASREQKAKHEIYILHQQLGGQVPTRDKDSDHPLQTEKGVDNLLHEVVELQLENKQLILEKARLLEEIGRLKKIKEKTIDNQYFERLKFAYDQVVYQNEEYERKLVHVEQQFGITLR